MPSKTFEKWEGFPHTQALIAYLEERRAQLFIIESLWAPIGPFILVLGAMPVLPEIEEKTDENAMPVCDVLEILDKAHTFVVDLGPKFHTAFEKAMEKSLLQAHELERIGAEFDQRSAPGPTTLQ